MQFRLQGLDEALQVLQFVPLYLILLFALCKIVLLVFKLFCLIQLASRNVALRKGSLNVLALPFPCPEDRGRRHGAPTDENSRLAIEAHLGCQNGLPRPYWAYQVFPDAM